MREFVHQVRVASRSKTLRELVHRKRRYKVLWEFVHQVRTPCRPKTLRDLVHLERR